MASYRADRQSFLTRIQQITEDCIRLSSTDSANTTTSTTVEHRLEVLVRDITAANGQYLSQEQTEELTALVKGVLSEVKLKQVGEKTSYEARRVTANHPGASSYDITEEQLQFLAKYGFTRKEMAKLFNTSESTIKRRLSKYHIKLREMRSMDVSDDDLDEKVRAIIGTNQFIGPNSIRVRLAKEGLRVNRKRVRDACHRVDPAGCAVRSVKRRNIVRRTYKVAGPNSLWHIDGNHKLIRWQMVIHGCIDGFSRHVNFLKASSNNKAETVFDNFIGAAKKFGIPSRIRVDHGSENVDVCTFMEGYRGENRGSAIRGKSAHNQRIERLWVDVWEGTTNEYYDLFWYMEQRNILIIDNAIHRAILLYVFLPRLNKALELFTFQYNNHTLSSENKSPNQLFIDGVLQNMNSNSSPIEEYMFQVGNTDSGMDINEEEIDDDFSNQLEEEEISSELEQDISPISQEKLQQLNLELNVLENEKSAEHGIGIFCKALEIVLS